MPLAGGGVLAKVLAHWAVTGLPLIMLSPLVALLLGMDVYGWKIMALTLLLGTRRRWEGISRRAGRR
ncbi:heme exporter protein CcmB [Salmonella enterica subsp. enterica]|nr:heme exporter protein CcmB [Salmonella enterica subsp. enterica]